MRLSKKDKEKAIRFLSLIECAVATRDSDDDVSKEMDKEEIEGFNALCKALGVVSYGQTK